MIHPRDMNPAELDEAERLMQSGLGAFRAAGWLTPSATSSSA